MENKEGSLNPRHWRITVSTDGLKEDREGSSCPWRIMPQFPFPPCPFLSGLPYRPPLLNISRICQGKWLPLRWPICHICSHRRRKSASRLYNEGRDRQLWSRQASVCRSSKFLCMLHFTVCSVHLVSLGLFAEFKKHDIKSLLVDF